jgi:hypothetical protein
MGRQRPVTTDSYIGAAAGLPFFIDPHVAAARSHGTVNRMPNGTNGYIDLSGSLIRNRTSRHHYHDQKCQLYNFTFTHPGVCLFKVFVNLWFHMLVFKLTIGLSIDL